jgi:hypothetical protein
MTYILVAAKNVVRIGQELTASSLLNGAIMSIDDIVKACLKGMKRFLMTL